MNRARLKEIAREIANEVETKSYDYWAAQPSDTGYSDTRDGEAVAVEINILEKTPEYVHVSVAVSAGGWSNYFPPATSVIVRKTDAT